MKENLDINNKMTLKRKKNCDSSSEESDQEINHDKKKGKNSSMKLVESNRKRKIESDSEDDCEPDIKKSIIEKKKKIEFSSDEQSSSSSEDEHSSSSSSSSEDEEEVDEKKSLSEEEVDNGQIDDQPMPDCGTIEHLELFNFMCHDHFEISFSPRVNFVIGKNGSGKSAILTAIVIVLGGRATNTGRGQSLTGFIKNGKTSAKIVLKLCNYSTSKKKTYKYAEYGPSIIVERIIKSDGTSSYVLKSSKGKVISRKKEELNEIIGLFSIQIENPVCILSQEVSRNFLNSKNPRDKYNFFMKATNLEQLRREYAASLQQSSIAKEILAKKKSFLPGIISELKELEKKVDVFTKFNEKKDHLTFLIAELLWSMVKQLEIEEKKPPKAIKDLDKKIDEAKVRYEEHKAEFEELEKLKENFSDSTQANFEAAIKGLIEIKAELIKRYDLLSKSKKDKQFKIQEINFELSNCHKDKTELSKKIQDIKKQIEQQEELIAEQERIKAKRIELQNEHDDTKQEIDRLRIEKHRKQEEQSKLSDQLKSITYRINKLSSDLNNKNNLLSNIKGNKKNALAKFGQHMPSIVRMIEDEARKGKFIQKPIGPLGNYIKLKDDRVSGGLEACLRGMMFAFVCDNIQDANHLTNLIRSNRIPNAPLILQRRFRARFDIRNEVSLDRYKSFLSYISIENDQVFNILIDKNSLEKTLFIPQDRAAVELLTNESIIPSNLKVAYSSQGTQFFPKKAGSNFRQYANNKKPSGILNSDTSSLILELEPEIAGLKEQIKQLQIEKADCEAVQRALNGELRGFDREIDKNLNKVNDISRQIYELSSVKEFKPEDLSIFEADFQQCVNQINTLKEECKSLEDDLKDIESKIKIVINDQEENEEEIHDKRGKFELQKKEAQSYEFKMQKNKEAMDRIELRVADFNQSKDQYLKELTEIQMKKEEAIQRAKEKHNEPIETNRKPQTIQVEIDELNTFLRENENRMGDKEQLFSAYKEKKIHYEKMKDTVEFLEEYIYKFSDSIKMRAKIYCSLRNEITKTTTKKFSENLKLLNFNGSLQIYHKATEVDGKMMKEQSLDIKINPKSSDPDMLYKDTRSLSGGERSFSTVAFLIALWESSYSPFNILDEVDVFMDNLTRSMALEALIESANKKRGKQYLFLSPLRPEKKSIQNLLKIYYMPEPKRVGNEA